MNFIFYQNILSIHQSAFLRALADVPDNEVTLIVAESMETGRDKQGWFRPDFGQCKIVVSPADDSLLSYVENTEAIHIFTGISAFPMVKKSFSYSCSIRGAIRIVYSEPWRTEGWRGFTRYMRYRYLSWKYSNKISALLLTGKMGVESFVRAGFPREKCHEWGYYTEVPDMTATTIPLGEYTVPRFIFIGTWDYRKNILGLICALKHITLPYECVLVGDGILRQQVEREIRQDKRFRYIGNVPNRQIGGIISCCDVLVLPSVFDGWGAVVNEALMCGTRALVSVKCGAASLITSAKQGAVFNLADIEGALIQEIRKGIQLDQDRNELRDWAIAQLSGRSAANRFMDICKTLS